MKGTRPLMRDLQYALHDAVDQTIEAVIAGRFKRWGRRWTQGGAHHLLRLLLWIAPCGTTCFEASYSPQPQLPKA